MPGVLQDGCILLSVCLSRRRAGGPAVGQKLEEDLRKWRRASEETPDPSLFSCPSVCPSIAGRREAHGQQLGLRPDCSPPHRGTRKNHRESSFPLARAMTERVSQTGVSPHDSGTYDGRDRCFALTCHFHVLACTRLQ
ncbi:hypothetical protein AAFF_G00076020 [Aldrovandia affinis]|uniref:Uncharacterized protein n=1 Tax=Aldrovandia affinis TaxID=143900 RepID=A0AAD7RY28_9TELE|nr:hypothetical protein AAFF_G00076020 [Aldrovandia affinis]